jgi:hypothetical protein
MKGAVVALLGLLLAGCASVPSPMKSPEDLQSLAGTWQGWVVTSLDFAPAVLEIRADGTFEMLGTRNPDVRMVTGTLILSDGTLRLDGTGGWRGTVTTSRMGGRRVLTIERDDRLSSARFTAAAPPVSP